MEERDDGALELRAAARVDGRGREGLPDDALADVGRDEQRDAGAQAVALLQQLVQQDHDQPRHDQLHHEQHADARAQVRRLPVEAAEDVHAGLTEGEDDGEELLRGLVQLAVGFQVEVYVDEVRAGEELESELVLVRVGMTSWERVGLRGC